MCLEVKSDYQKSSWFKSLFHEMNLEFGGLSKGPRHATPENLENGASQIG